MGLRDWRAKHSMKDPVRGQFRVTDQFFAHPNGSSARQMLTGVLTAPGLAPTAGEHLADVDGRWVGHDVLPVLIDRADPTTFVIAWDEVPKPDYRAQARDRAAQAAAAQNAGYPAQNAGYPAQAGADPAGAAFYDADSAAAAPAWAVSMLDDLARQGILPPTDGNGWTAPTVVNLPTQVIDLTAGHLSAADAAGLADDGEAATAVLTGIAEVAVPQFALPGPTASLCDLTLQVTRMNGQTYTAQTRLGFRDAHRRALIGVLGVTLPVRIDRVDPTRVAVDVAAFDAQHPGQ